MNRGAGWLLRWLATLLVRGPGSRHVLGDLDEGMLRDLERGTPVWRARGRYLTNLVASSLALAWERVRRGLPGRACSGVSRLDVKLGWRTLWKHPVLSLVSVLSLAVGIPVGLAPGHLLDAFESALPVQDGGMALRPRPGRSRDGPLSGGDGSDPAGRVHHAPGGTSRLHGPAPQSAAGHADRGHASRMSYASLPRTR